MCVRVGTEKSDGSELTAPGKLESAPGADAQWAKPAVGQGRGSLATAWEGTDGAVVPTPSELDEAIARPAPATVGRDPNRRGIRLRRQERLLLGLALLGSAPCGILIAKIGLLPVVALIGIAVVGLVVRRPQFAVLASIPICLILNPFVSALPLGMIGAVLPFVVWVVLRRTGVLGYSNAPKRLPLAFAGWLILSYYLFSLPGYSNPDRQGSLLQLVAASFLVFGAGSLRARPVDLVRVIGVTTCLASLAALLTAGRDDEGRIVALNLNTNYLGAMMAIGIVCCGSAVFATHRPAWLLLTPPMIVVVVQTHSRGTLLSLGAGLVVLLACTTVKTRVIAALLLVFSVSFLPIIEGFAQAKLLGNRNEESYEGSNRLRAAVLKDALRLTARHPLTGVGYGLFQPRSVDNPAIGKPLNTHNDYLRLSSETGIVGLALFLALAGVPFLRRRTLAFVLLAPGITSFLVATIDANILSELTVSCTFWAMLGTLWTADCPEAWRKTDEASPNSSNHDIPNHDTSNHDIPNHDIPNHDIPNHDTSKPTVLLPT